MMNPLDLVTFDTQGFDALGDLEGVRRWYSPQGDGVGLYHFPLAPDIDADPNDAPALRASFRRSAANAGIALIECDTFEVNHVRLVHKIVKVPQQPTGMTYLGSFTIPRRDFSYVLKVQCQEEGITGMREAAVLDELLARGEVSVDGTTLEGWMRDPYDPDFRAPLLRNRAEAEEYDSQFPEHPLTRARSLLAALRRSLWIAPSVQAAAPFDYPPRGAPKKLKWKWW